MTSLAPFVKSVRVSQDGPRAGYPFALPVVQHLVRKRGLGLHVPVTILCGDNGSGKSTLMEALAVHLGFSTGFFHGAPEPGTALAEHITVRWTGKRRPATGLFLRADAVYGAPGEMERIVVTDSNGDNGPPVHKSMLELVAHYFTPNGLYILDEPEVALSAPGCMALLRLVADLAAQGSQFVIATHSPILLAVPGARILEIGEAGVIRPVAYDAARPVTVNRAFLEAPQDFVRLLLDSDSQ